MTTQDMRFEAEDVAIALDSARALLMLIGDVICEMEYAAREWDAKKALHLCERYETLEALYAHVFDDMRDASQQLMEIVESDRKERK